MKNLKRNIVSFSASMLATLLIFASISVVSAKTTTRFGSIEGSLIYPGESIPANMTVCAQNTKTKINYCNHRHLKNTKYKNGLGFKITVPIGKYTVYALHPIFNEHGKKTKKYMRAYETEFTACGQTSECKDKSHKPSVFNVKGGQTISGIDHLEETAGLKKAMKK